MNAAAKFETIDQLDLDPIKVKLMHKDSGEGWSLEYASTIEGEYRRFLCLMKLYPNEPLAPLFDVDIFWHYHILDTVKYAADCDRIFGYFLHHFPYLGLRGEDDEAAHHRVGARTKELYDTTFGADGQCADDVHSSAMTAWSMTGGAADGAQRSGASAKTAWSMTGAIADGAQRFGATAKTAWSMTGAPPDGAQRFGANAKTAWSMTGAPNDGAQRSGAGAKTAWSMTGAQGVDMYAVRPTIADVTGARSRQRAQNDSGDASRNRTRPMLALAV